MTSYQLTNQPSVDPRSASTAQASLRGAVQSWQTPGSVLRDRLVDCETVQAIYERHDRDKFLVFVILEDDDDDTLDRIFESEQELFTMFARMPFDVRVMRPRKEWDASALRAGATVHFERT